MTALADTAFELLAAGLLGRQTLLGDSLPVLRVGFCEASLWSTVTVLLLVGSDGPAVREAGRLQLNEVVAFFFARPCSDCLGSGRRLLLAFGGRGDLFALDGDPLLQ